MGKSLFPRKNFSYNNPDFYSRFSHALLYSFLHALDPEKIYYTQDQISDLIDKWGSDWLKDVVVMREGSLFLDLLEIKEKAGQKYFNYFKDLSDDPAHFSVQDPYELDVLQLPAGAEDFPQDTQEQDLRWWQRHEFLKLVVRASLPSNGETNLSEFLTMFYEKKLRGFQILHELDGDEVSDFVQDQLELFQQSVFSVLSYFSININRGSNAFSIDYGDSSIKLHNQQGLIRVMSTSGSLKEKDLLRPGDLVVAVESQKIGFKRDTTPERLRPLIFHHYQGRHGLIDAVNLREACCHDFLEENDVPVEMFFTVLRRRKGASHYDLLRVPVLKKVPGMEDSYPSQSDEESLASGSDFFSTTLYPPSASSHRYDSVLVVKILGFSGSQNVDRWLDMTADDNIPHLRLKEVALLYDRWNHLKLTDNILGLGRIYSIRWNQLKLTYNILGEIYSFYRNLYQTIADHQVGSIVIDLRNNRGGYCWLSALLLRPFVTISDFDEDSRLSYTDAPYEFSIDDPVSREKTYQFYLKKIKLLESNHSLALREKIKNIPITVLVNEESASAAEEFALELRARGRAIFVGSPTVGKGLATGELPVFPGLELSLRKFFTSDGSFPQEVGVPLDIRFPGSIWEVGEEERFMKSLLPSQAFLDAELYSYSPLAPGRHALVNNPALRDPELIRQLTSAFKEHLNQDYFLQRKAWKDQREAERVDSTISLRTQDYSFYDYEDLAASKDAAFFFSNPPPRPPKDATPGMSGDLVLDQALWIARKYAELLGE